MVKHEPVQFDGGIREGLPLETLSNALAVLGKKKMRKLNYGDDDENGDQNRPDLLEILIMVNAMKIIVQTLHI